MRWSNLIVIIGLIWIQSCIDPFVPNTTQYDDMLFMQCLFSDDTTESCLLYISRSVPMLTIAGSAGSNIPEPIGGATAHIVSSSGEQFLFTESDPGSYRLPDAIRPEKEVSYQLLVEVNGESFASELQYYFQGPPIDSVNYQHVQERLSETGEVYHGYRFAVSTHENDLGPAFFRWDLEASFQYTVPYDATHIWDGSTTHPASNRDLKTCWKSKDILGIFIDNTLGFSENRIINSPLNFESQYGEALSSRYSLLVKQRKISESSWSFWSDMDQLVNQSGGLYETQPFRTQGNVYCTSNQELFVAGLFEVASVTETRIFVDRPTEFENIPVVCRLDTVGTEDLPWYLLPPGTWVTFDFYSEEYLTSYESCYDCTKKGGSTLKPPFWIHE